jgi:hypothetical protein
MKWCARWDSSRWVCERHPDRPFAGSRACTCGGVGIPCPVCNPADEYTEPTPPQNFPGRREKELSGRRRITRLEA